MTNIETIDNGAPGCFPARIGRLHLGDALSDGDGRNCAGGCEQEIPKGHAIYWPPREGEYPDDVDPSCIACAIDRSESDQSWCVCNTPNPDAPKRQPIDPHFAGPVVSFDVAKPYYLASCDSCGWVGSSEHCGRDTGGDDSDVYCPRCNAAGADCGKVANRAPTQDAYDRACRALNWRTEQLRANGVEPYPIQPNDPQSPPEGHVFRVTAGDFAEDVETILRDCLSVQIDREYDPPESPDMSVDGIEAAVEKIAALASAPADRSAAYDRLESHLDEHYYAGARDDLRQVASAPAGDGVGGREAVARAHARHAGSTAWWWEPAFDDNADETAKQLRENDLSAADDILAALARPRAAVGDWSFDMTSAPEGVDLLVYRHDGGTVPWVNGVRAIASKEDGEWYGDNGDAITTPAAWTALQSPPAKVGDA